MMGSWVMRWICSWLGCEGESAAMYVNIASGCLGLEIVSFVKPLVNILEVGASEDKYPYHGGGKK